MIRLALAHLLLFALPLGGCEARGDEPEEPANQEITLEPKKELQPPADYHGPIDPQWPPSRPANFQVALEASQLYRSQVKKGKRPLGPAYRKDGKGLFVEEGQVGDFHFIEVVLGENAHPDHPMPLIVLLHGRGGRPTIPEGPYETTVPLRLFIPRGPDKLGDGYNWLATWTNSGELQLLTRSLSARVDQLAPAIRAFVALRPTLGKPIVVGFSQGGILAFTLATRYPGDFAAAFPMAGWLPPALYPTPKKGQHFPYIFAQHGAVDTTVPAELGRKTVKDLRARGLRVDYNEIPKVGHVVTPGMDKAMRQALQRFVSGYFGGDWDDLARQRQRKQREQLQRKQRLDKAKRSAPAAAPTSPAKKSAPAARSLPSKKS